MSSCLHQSPYNRNVAKAKRIPKKRTVSLRRGRPTLHQESWSKVSVVLFDRQVAKLDTVVKTMRGSSHALSRATIIRALIDGLLESRLDISHAHSESELSEAIADRLRSVRRAAI